MESNSLFGGFLQRGYENSARARLLNESNDADILCLGARLELQLKVFIEILALGQLANLREFLENRNMCQVVSGVFPCRDLGLGVVKGDGHKDVRVALCGITADCDVRVKYSRCGGINGYGVNSD